MYAVIILFLNFFSESFGALFARYFSKTYPSYIFSSFLLINTLFFLPIGLLYSLLNFEQVDFMPMIRESWHLLLIIGLCAGVYYRFILVVNTKVQASTLQIINTSRAIIVLILATIFLSEKLTIDQYIGAAILISATLFYVRSKTLRGSLPYILLAFAITSIFAVALVAEGYLIGRYGLASYLPLGWGMEVFFLWIFSSKLALREVQAHSFGASAKRDLIIFGSLIAISSISYVLSISAWSSVSFVNAAHIFQAPLTVFLAIYILKEDNLFRRKVFSILVATLGLWLLF